MARLLLDEQLPRRLNRPLPAHEVSTVRSMQWTGLKNGILLRRAESSFDVFVTMDKSIPFQQAVSGLNIGVLVLRAVSNSFENLAPRAEAISQAADAVRPGEVAELDLRTQPEASRE